MFSSIKILNQYKQICHWQTLFLLRNTSNNVTSDEGLGNSIQEGVALSAFYNLHHCLCLLVSCCPKANM